MATQQSSLPFIILAVIVLVGAGVAGGYLYYRERPSTGGAGSVVAVGDNVTVNYIGIFGSGPDQGKVFDTSIFRVASDPAAYPKAIDYHSRVVLAANYTPLPVHVGGTTPQSGYSLGGLSFIGVVTGFWQGLVGIPANQTRTIVVPPSLGYGALNLACVATRPLSYNVPIVQTLTGTTFTTQYPGVLASTGARFSDPHFGWPVLILSANASFVTIENLPSPGWTASPSGWPVVVTSIQSTSDGQGAITLTNELFPSQAGLLQGNDYLKNGPCTSQAQNKFIVSAVDLASGTYTENYNQEVQGETLIFMVTVVGVFA